MEGIGTVVRWRLASITQTGIQNCKPNLTPVIHSGLTAGKQPCNSYRLSDWICAGYSQQRGSRRIGVESSEYKTVQASDGVFAAECAGLDGRISDGRRSWTTTHFGRMLFCGRGCNDGWWTLRVSRLRVHSDRGVQLEATFPSGNLSAAGPSTTTRRYHAYQAAFSRRTSVRQVQEFLCQRLHVKSEDLRLWHLGEDSNSQDLKLLEEESTVLEDVGFKDEDGLLVEVRSRDGTWPEEISSLVSRLASTFFDAQKCTHLHRVCRSSGFTPAVGGTSSVRGITGLNNLGNTCYMNTSLQVWRRERHGKKTES